MTNVGFIGLGEMGAPMAEHLVHGNNDVTAFDIDQTAIQQLEAVGVEPARESACAVKGAEVVFLSLPTPDTVEHVVDKTADVFEREAVLVDLSTSTPATTERLVDRLAERDVDVLGAPVSGGNSGAQAGTLSVMVGGDRSVYEACLPLFEAFANDAFHVGDNPGHGHAVKLLNNYLSFTGLLAASEAVVLGCAAGLDRETLLEVFNASSGQNSATKNKLPNYVLSETYDMGFPIELMEKDIRLFMEFGEEYDAPLLLGNVVRNLIGYARSQQDDEADMTRVYDFFEDQIIRN